MKFRLFNKNAKDYVRGSSGAIVVFDLISWARYANENNLANLNSYEIEQLTSLITQSGTPIFLPLENN